MRQTVVALAAVVLLRAAAVHAQARARTWDETRVRARAAESAPEVRAASARLDAAHATRVYAHVPIVGNPTVGVRALFGVPNESAATYSVQLGLPLDVSGQRAAWGREADFAVAQAEADVAAARNDAVTAARRAWVEAAAAEALVDVANARLGAAREALAATRARVEAHASTALDAALAEREHGEAEADLAGAHAAAEQARARLREALDLSSAEPLALSPLGTPAAPTGLTAQSAAALALDRRPEPRALGSLASRWSAAEGRLRAAAVAPLFIAAEAEMQGNRARALSFGGSLQWSIPALHTAQGERAAALGEAHVATTRAEVTARAVAREAAAAFTDLTLRLDELRALDATAVPAAERTVVLTTAMFDAGAADTFRVLLARRDLYTLRVRRLTTLRDAWLARVALDRALGEELR